MLAIVGIACGLLILAGLFVWFGDSLDRFHDRVAFSGRTMDTTPIHLKLADKALVVPANMIRFPAERRDGSIERVNLLLHWPDLDGFSKANADTFRDNDPSAPLLFLTIFAKDADYGTTGWLGRNLHAVLFRRCLGGAEWPCRGQADRGVGLRRRGPVFPA